MSDLFVQTPILMGEICKLTEAPYLFSRVTVETLPAPPKSETSGGRERFIEYVGLNPAIPRFASATCAIWFASTQAPAVP